MTDQMPWDDPQTFFATVIDERVLSRDDANHLRNTVRWPLVRDLVAAYAYEKGCEHRAVIGSILYAEPVRDIEFPAPTDPVLPVAPAPAPPIRSAHDGRIVERVTPEPDPPHDPPPFTIR